MKKWIAGILMCMVLISTMSTALYASEDVIQVTEETVTEETVAEDTGTTDNGGKEEIIAPSAILIESTTGQVLYEKDADEKRAPASVTKVMTLLLIFDALHEGRIQLQDEVPVSEYAASMGGSQVFLEVGETQTVDTMIKCIAVASANDACVAMSEFISGSETEFVNQMNKRAEGLGMEHTHFVNCNGLDAEGHLTTARDIALMSRELILKYPEIHDYSMIWMENITHKTAKGESEFGLTNTNKLVRQYEYATGLKTGSTNEAKFCVSATGRKNDVELIAVIMAAPDSKTRFLDAIHLMNSGFGKCQLYKDTPKEKLEKIKITNGVADSLNCEYSGDFEYVDTTGSNLGAVTAKNKMKKNISAPIEKGKKVGSRVYSLDGETIGELPIVASDTINKAKFKDYLLKAFRCVLPVKMVK
ncbi:MAG: D-alanyl-D-alanine carboxypeptidase [Hespellia sp.]|nr:D-alanyl-D-alanine carboxypeptidase [Hespellia sp.]